jgi:hypothetical protein
MLDAAATRNSGDQEFVELLTGIPGASRSVTRIVLIKRSGADPALPMP